MIEPKDVPVWLMSKGIGHIVLSKEEPGSLCRTPHNLVWGGETQTAIPKRICQECREAMQHITKR